MLTWFDISVNDVFCVQVHECFGHLGDILLNKKISNQNRIEYLGGLLFREATILSELLVQFSLGSEFENQIHPLGIIKVSIQPQNILMSTPINRKHSDPLNQTSNATGSQSLDGAVSRLYFGSIRF